jgi:hypothetical protein
VTTLQFASFAQPATYAAIGPSGTLTPELDLNVDPAGTPSRVTGPPLSLLGPEAIAGMDPGLFGRRFPDPGSGEATDNHLPCVEILVADLPWRFTPAAPGPHGLMPWLVLVVVESGGEPLRDGNPLPILHASVAGLPDLDEAWAWAHIQMGDGGQVARLLCPRRLAANTSYLAAVVPAFRGGVDAGLGRTPAADTAHATAWRVTDAGELDLPVYLSWEFATGPSGDFKDLVERIQPLTSTEAVGAASQTVDVSRPWPADPPVPDSMTIALQGALRPTGPEPTGTLTADQALALAQRLAKHVDAAGEDPTAPVAPPLYGGQHAGRESVDAPAVTADWLAQLNLDARRRLAAGRGAHYVREHQEELMARAWEVAGAIREANRLRAQAELGARVAASLHRRHVAPLAPGELLALTVPAHDRLRSVQSDGESITVTGEVRASRLTDGVASTTFARLARPSGPLSRRSTGQAPLLRSVPVRGLAGGLDARLASTLMDRFKVPSDQAAPQGTVLADVQTASDLDRRTRAARTLTMLGVVKLAASANGHVDAASTIASNLQALPVAPELLRATGAGQLPDALAQANVAAGAASAIDGSLAGVAALDNSPEAVIAAAGAGPQAGPAGVRVDAAGFTARLVDGLAPEPLAARRVAARAIVPAALGDPEGFAPVMIAPDLPAPLALGLLADGAEWFMPGLSGFPSDRARLLAPNDQFIESFLIGANHEFNRELLWREYPTDRRGTSFRVFWPQVPGATDIPAITDFAAGDLGTHLSQRAGHISVLLVRAELLSRYPQTQVFAVPAQSTPAGLTLVDDSASWKAPLFMIPVDGTTTAYAFDVDADELEAEAGAGAPGWFFVFQEHAYRLRFGFDENPDAQFLVWNDLSWSQVIDQRGFASVNRAVPQPEQAQGPADPHWGVDAADTARIVLRQPVRVAIHSSSLVRR